MKILVVEDDPKLARFLARVFTEEGWTVDCVASGADADGQAQLGCYRLVVLDWMLPDLDGLSVCRNLRRRGADMPILMLTARGEVRERVLGLDSGADDYVIKPFEVEELVARARALLRRGPREARSQHGPLTIDRSEQRAWIAGRPLDLTPREFAILLQLAGRDGEAVTKSELLARVWNLGFDPGSNVVEAHVSRLRDKLADHASLVETVRGVGYRLCVASPD
jgi:DNA-binding response OmpR family regulator